MKKENTSIIFLSVITVIILICAVLLLILAGLSFISAPKNQNIYDFIKDHGSVLGAILGAVVLAVTVYVTLASQARSIERQMKFQDEQTKRQIEAQSRQIQEQIDAERANSLNNRLFYLFEQASDLMIDISELMRKSLPLESSSAVVSDSYNLYLGKINRLISLNIQLNIGENKEVGNYAKVTTFFFLLRACQSGIITIEHCRLELGGDIQPYISIETRDIIMQCRELVKVGELKDLSESCGILYKRSRCLNQSIASYIDERMRALF